jgi:hypothetical protein
MCRTGGSPATHFNMQGYDMKALLLSTMILCALFLTSVSAETGETYFKFKIGSREEIKELTRIISIDNVKDDVVFAYAAEQQWKTFQALGYEYTILPHPGTLIEPMMSSLKAGLREWDTYPTYEAYVGMMNQYAVDYPELCTIVNVGSSVEGRSILFAKISDSVAVDEDEPEVMYTGTMHGDETTGYVLLIRLIDSLLSSYGTDSLVTRLIDSCEIWINPLANPDGTYNGGNHTVGDATRTNANGVDLNRNFPDPQDGDHPDGYAWQPETIAMMNLADSHKFVISANFHGGAEVVNYPWDTWATLHADNQWYIDISRTYADSAQYYSPSGYLTDLNNGITNGYAWYTINGGRQDYMNWWHGCREVTIELSYTKLPPADQLPAYWNYNRVSFLDYLENALYGIRGIVTDAVTGLPVSAKITVASHDFDHSEVYTDPEVGDYHRMIEAGVYDVEFSAPGYLKHTEYSITVPDNQTTVVNVAMEQLTEDPVLTFVDHTAGEAGPDDTVTMKITLENIGGGNAYNLTGILSVADPYITITQSTSSFPTILAEGGTGTSVGDYEFVISPDSPDLRYVELKLNLTADGGFSDSLYFEFFVGKRVVAFSDDFSFDLEWTGLGGSGEWTIGPATGGAGSDSYGNPDPSADHSPGADNRLLGNDLNGGTGGDYSSSLGTTYWVTSPYIDCSGFSGVQMTFYRWLGVERNNYDHAYLQADNGGSWVTVFENGGTTIDESSWTMQFHDLAQYADSNPDFRIRFGIGPTDGGMDYCGWNIDDIVLKGYGEPPAGSPNIAYSPTSLSDTLHLGETAIDTVKSYNTGEALLRVRFSSTDTWLELNEEQQNISAGDSLALPVIVTTEDLIPGDYEGEIEFTSNDPDFPTGSIPVNLHIHSPEIFLPETSVQESLSVEEQSSVPFVIVNNGPGRLEYEIKSIMFDGKPAAVDSLTPKLREPLGYRISDGDKSPSKEPFFPPTTEDYGGPDNWGYLWVDSDEPDGPDFEWIDISTMGTEIEGLGDDDTSSAIAIGFDFPFYENSYSHIYMGSNGILTFGSGSAERNNVDIPNSAVPDNMIAIWWDDLDPRRGGHIYYYLDSENSRFIASFVEIPNYFSLTGTGSLSFQAILYSNGEILLQYAVMDPGSDYDGLAGSTIGIENASGDDGLQVVYNAEYMHDDLAILFNAAGWMAVEPASGAVEPFSSDTVQILFDATGLEIGTYSGRLDVTSNDPVSPSSAVPVMLQVLPAFTCGDVNSDGNVNILDATSLINYLYKNGPEPVPPECGDVDHSGALNLLDATYIINYLYKNGPEPDCP